jgi:hypothetical protein
MRGLASVVMLAVLLAGCASSNSSSGDDGTACRAAGGACYVGSLVSACTVQGPTDCGNGPAGQFCCLAFADAGDGG